MVNLFYDFQLFYCFFFDISYILYVNNNFLQFFQGEKFLYNL